LDTWHQRWERISLKVQGGPHDLIRPRRRHLYYR